MLRKNAGSVMLLVGMLLPWLFSFSRSNKKLIISEQYPVVLFPLNIPYLSPVVYMDASDAKMIALLPKHLLMIAK